MKAFKADMHIHTVLSPCADLEMSPNNIVKTAISKGLDFIGITDHNSTKQTAVVCNIGKKNGLTVIPGVEVTSREEVHCLCFFEDQNSIEQFQEFIDQNLPRIKYNPHSMGFQVCVDENDCITEEFDYYLGVALKVGIDEICAEVQRLNGIFIPAHINRSRYSLFSQLGFAPVDLKYDGMEIFNRSNLTEFLQKNPVLKNITFIKNSDSHILSQIGSFFTTYNLSQANFQEFDQALANKNGRFVKI